jgi:PAS domain S-box-containing protein
MENQRRDSHLKHTKAIKDLLIVSAISVAIFVIASHLNILEKFIHFSQRYEHLQLDEVIIVCAILAFVMMIFSVRRVHELQQDIGERKRAEEALRRHEERFRLLIENASDIITVLDRDGIIRYGSPSVANILGYNPKELIGENAFALVHPDDVPDVLQTFTHILEAPGLTQAVQFRLRHQDDRGSSSSRSEAISVLNRVRPPSLSIRGVLTNASRLNNPWPSARCDSRASGRSARKSLVS